MKKIIALTIFLIYLAFFAGILASSHSSGHHIFCTEKDDITAVDHTDAWSKNCCDFSSVKDKLKLHVQQLPSFFKVKISPALNNTPGLAFFSPLSFKDRKNTCGYTEPAIYQSTYLKNRVLLI